MSNSEKTRQIETLRGAKRLLLVPLAWVARLWAASLRFEVTQSARAALARDEPQVFLLWHNRLFVIAEIYRRFRRPACPQRSIYGLISASRDGSWLATFFDLVGIRAIRGSSSWRASEALRQAVATVKEGNDLGITPDGPRGPCYHFQPGAVLVASRTKVPVVLLGMAFEKGRRLRSWDGFYLPLPFSKVLLDGQCIPDITVLAASGQRSDVAAALAQSLSAISPDTVVHPRDGG